jgi:hypothetical protein
MFSPSDRLKSLNQTKCGSASSIGQAATDKESDLSLSVAPTRLTSIMEYFAVTSPFKLPCDLIYVCAGNARNACADATPADIVPRPAADLWTRRFSGQAHPLQIFYCLAYRNMERTRSQGKGAMLRRSYSVGRPDDHLLLQVSVTVEARCAEPALPEHALDRIIRAARVPAGESTDCGMAVDNPAPHRAAPPLNRSNVSST